MKSITVILCTYNRCQKLAKALSSLALQAMPADVNWHVLVVDNNSRDQTRALVEQFSSRYPDRFRYLFEPQPGKSYALNTGIRAAAGEILAFMDDDVVASTDWLEKLTVHLHDGQWVGVGGRVFPDRSFTPPSWLSSGGRYVTAPLVMFDLGTKAGPLTEAPFGTNMAIQREVFNRYGDFRTDLGPQPGSEIRGEDSEFAARLLSAGEPLLYEPAAVVYHEVSPDRLKKKYFEAWWFDKGRSEILRRERNCSDKLQIAGVPLVLLRRSGLWLLRWLLTFDPDARFEKRLKLCALWGGVVESYRQSAAEIDPRDM